ncbi:MAG: TrkA family potassium uptake protein [Bacteroidetes bacterium]|nr:TrkA family potassium uptake protein [Bacteroidota bacterium]
MKNARYAVIGLGLFGTSIARELSRRGAEVLAIDNVEHQVEGVSGDVAFGVTMDATDLKALKAQNIHEMDAVIVAIGEGKFDTMLLCVVLLLELKVKRIIARAEGPRQRMILEKIGCKEILSPEDEVAMLVAERLINPNIIYYMPLPDNYEIVEIKTPPSVANRSLADINLRNRYQIDLITIKREVAHVNREGSTITEKHILGVVGQDTILLATDTLLVFGIDQDIQRFIEINQ